MNKIISISTLILVIINTYFLYLNDCFNNKIIIVDDYSSYYEDMESGVSEVMEYLNEINYYTEYISNDNLDYKFDLISNEELINQSKLEIEEVLNKINYQVIDELYNNNDQGLNVFLGDTISYDGVSNPNGLSYYLNNSYNIVIDISKSNIKEVFCHELLHVMENNLSKKVNIFSNWNDYNPVNFNYLNSYNFNNDFQYTISDPGNEYFVNSYAKTYGIEDRAIIFSHYCAYDNSYESFPNINKKTIYLLNELNKQYGFDVFISSD